MFKDIKNVSEGFPGGAAVKTLCCQHSGSWVPSLVWELDPTSHVVCPKFKKKKCLRTLSIPSPWEGLTCSSMKMSWYVFQGDKSGFFNQFLKIFLHVTWITHTQHTVPMPSSYQVGQNSCIFFKPLQVILLYSRAKNYSRASCKFQPSVLGASLGFPHPECPALCGWQNWERWGNSVWHIMALRNLQSGLECKTGVHIKRKSNYNWGTATCTTGEVHVPMQGWQGQDRPWIWQVLNL